MLCIIASPSTLPAQSGIAIEDIRGRSVTLDEPARRVLIDDGRFLIALSLLHSDPVSLLAAWPRDINRIGEHTYARYVERFPALKDVPATSSSSGNFALESVLSANPDVAVYTLGRGPSDDDLRVLEGAGIPVVFIDFFSQPFDNLDPSLRILGQIIGREAEAEAVVAFRREHLLRITARLGERPGLTRPRVLLEVHAGMSGECCSSPGNGNIGNYISLVGGHNIGADVIPGAIGKLDLEYVISADPRIYIATGGPHLEKAGGLVIGPGYSGERARNALKAMAERAGVALIAAVRDGNVHGLSHQLLNSPLDILAVEALARWIHPELFGDVDPARTMAEINERFLAVPLEGIHWIDLR